MGYLIVKRTAIKSMVITSILLSCLSITNCATPPYLQDIFNDPRRIALFNESQISKLSYLARYLIPSSDRKKLITKMAESHQVEPTITLDNKKADQISVQAFADRLASGKPIIDQMERISQIYLPSQIDDKIIDTLEKANALLSTMIANRVYRFADQQGYTVSCLNQCNTVNQVYLLSSTQSYHANYLYWPQEIAIVSNVKPLQKAPPDPLRDKALGFPVSWQSPEGNSFTVDIHSDIIRSSKGTIESKTHTADGSQYIKGWNDLTPTKIGRAFRTSFFDNPYFVFGEYESYPPSVYYNKGIYSFDAGKKPYFVSYRLVEPMIR